MSEKLRFRDQGLSSAQTLALIARLSEHLGRSIPLAMVWEYPSVAKLSAELLSDARSTHRSSPSEKQAGSERRLDEPVAIVGMGCRLPGGIHDPGALWQALLQGLDAVREVPTERWDLSQWFDKDPQAPGRMSTRWGGFIDDVAGFDAGFFGISPKEATQMDPQQRLALEVTWEALEDAGLVPRELAGSRTGVFVGAWSQDYAELCARDPQSVAQHSATGWNNSVIPARIAYALGLRGPALTVNTACSSSLVAVHMAVQSLRSGESELALVSGVNLMLAPHTSVQMTKFGAMSPTGRCRTFAADADGYVRGEGCAALVLRPLSDALRRGERIYALIRGSAINNDGASNGLTAPNPDAQAEVLAEAWQRAGVPVHEVSYVEAHGTGTPLGDPIEASALGRVFGEGRSEALRIGSLKTNFGHLEAAAGIAGLMKSALALHHGELPRSLHCERPNPLIPFAQWQLKLVAERESFPGEAARTAGVSSFGYGGTNGHVALHEPAGQRNVLLALAAETQADLVRLAAGVCAQLTDIQGDRALGELATAHGTGGARAVVKGRHPATLQRGLRALAAEPDAQASARPYRRPHVVFVFSGHGSQWLGMGRDLLASEPTFSRVLRGCDRFIQAAGGPSIVAELCAREELSRLNRTEIIQPVLYALQVALARMLQSWGIEPGAVIGQSIGEVAAAVIGGALSEETGAKLIVRWSSLVARSASGQGAMVVAALSRSEADLWLSKAAVLGIAAADLAISGLLSAQSVSFSGAKQAILTLQAAMQAAGVRVHHVEIDYACHSPRMHALADELAALTHDLSPLSLQIPMWSTVHARLVRGAELNGAYWAANLALPIALEQGVAELSHEATHFIDIGPHAITLRSLQDTLASAASSAVALATCFRAEPAWSALEELVTNLWCAGVPVDWQAFAGFGRANRTPPTPLPLLVSAHDEASLRAQAGRWAQWLTDHPEASWADVIRTASGHRTHFPQRASIAAENAGEAIEALQALSEGRAHALLLEGTARERGQAVFVFPGQGSQWHEMGRALLAESTVFASVVAACDDALRPYTGWSVLALLRCAEGDDCPSLAGVEVIQPALFTMNVALAALWRSLGVEPCAVVGHSQGEIAAAVVSGALSLADGARIIALRSQLLARLSGTGAMAAIELPVSVVAQKLKDEHWSDLHVAVVNTHSSTVVAGAPERIEAWIAAANGQGIFCRRVPVDYASHTPHVEPILDALRAALQTLTPRLSDVPMISTVTGEPISGLSLDADYWCRNLREPVRLDQALDQLASSNHSVFIEASAHPVLSMALTAAASEHRLVVGSLRRDAGGLRALYTNLGALHVAGYSVDFAALAGPGPLASLPTYAFRHQRYWLPRPVAQSDATLSGLSPVKHPLLGSLTSLADSQRFLLTGRLSLTEQSWLAGHAVFGTVLLPGTALLELALSAARAVGGSGVSELTLTSPLALPQRGAVRLQLQVDAKEEHGGRSLALFSRVEDAGEDQPWTQHANGVLLAADTSSADPTSDNWPPAHAQTIDLNDAYEKLAALGYDYGPSFQCLKSAWRSGSEIFAHVLLPTDLIHDAAEYGVHPALLDAALHAVLVAGLGQDGSGPLWLPFSWSNVSQYAAGATELRVRFVLADGPDDTRAVSLRATDGSGRVVLSVGALRLRQATAEQLRGASEGQPRDLYHVDYRPVALHDVAPRAHVLGQSDRLAQLLGAPHHADVWELLAGLDVDVPPLLVIDLTRDFDAPPSTESVHEVPTFPSIVQDATAKALHDLQILLTESRLSATSMLWVTQRAVATKAADDAPLDLCAAPIWGLIRSARSEAPERSLRLIDLDRALPTRRTLQRLVATTSEPELVLRDGAALAPRLARLHGPSDLKRPDFWGTVLVTGGLGELGQSLARHLVKAHGVKHLLLTSRRGMETPGTQELIAALEHAGAQTVRVATCDVAERSQLAAVIDQIPLSRALCAVFHLAGVLDDGIATGLSPEQLRRVLLPKLDGAFHLHELTRAQPVSTFVMFSSVAGILGFQGQANYAAGNAFLDALVAERRRLKLPAQSLAWGFWEPQGTGMSAHLGATEIARMARQGVAPLPVEAGFALLDSALLRSDATLVPAQLDLTALSEPGEEAVPAMFRSLVARAPRLAAAASSHGPTSLRARLSSLSEAERSSAVLNAVREEVASVLGLTPFEVGVDLPLRSLGLDSLMAVELKNRLARRFECALPTTLAFDYPTSTAIAGLLRDKLQRDQPAPWNDAEIRRKLQRLSIDALRRSGVLDMLMREPEEDAPARPSGFAPKPDLDIEELAHDSLLDEMERMLGGDRG